MTPDRRRVRAYRPDCRRASCGVPTVGPGGWVRRLCPSCTSALLTQAFSDPASDAVPFPPVGGIARSAGRPGSAGTGNAPALHPHDAPSDPGGRVDGQKTFAASSGLAPAAALVTTAG